MPANYLHGVETLRINNGPIAIRAVKTAVIGLVCAAATFAVSADYQTLNEPKLILRSTDGAAYAGPDLPGFTARQALTGIYDHGAGTLILVNIFDPAKHKQSVADEPVALDVDKGALAHGNAFNAVVKSADGNVTFDAGEDYTLDPVSGAIIRVATGAIAASDTLKVSYDYADLSLVTAADVIGADGGPGNRTGLYALLDAQGLYGFKPKLIAAPGFSEQPTVAAAMIAIAEKVRGDAYIDAPAGTSFATALAGRGPAGAINFNTSSDRAMLSWPHVKVTDPNGTTRLEGQSARTVGLRAKVDIEEGYHVSTSNHELAGVLGLEVPLYASISDPVSDVNALSEVGICTVFNAFGTGFRAWGNRSAAFPTATDVTTFQAVRRTFDVVDDSIEEAALPFIDRPITAALIDAIVASCNAFIDQLVARGVLLSGSKVWYSPERNPAEAIATGHLTFSRRYMAPTSAERITHEAEIDISLFNNLVAA